MTADAIANAIATVVSELQRTSGRPCGELTGDTRPIGDLIGFDSLSGIEATVAVEAALGAEFGIDNLFAGEIKGRKRALTIAETAERIAKQLNAKVA